MIEIALAQRGDIDSFLGLWEQFQKELNEMDGPMMEPDFYRRLFTNVVDGNSVGVCLLAYDGEIPVGALLWCAFDNEIWPEKADNVYGWGAYTAPTHRRFGVSQSLRSRAVLELNGMGIKQVWGSVLLSNKPGIESSRKIGFRPTELVGFLNVEDRAARLMGHKNDDGDCMYGYTDGFLTEGECPLCGRGNNEGEES